MPFNDLIERLKGGQGSGNFRHPGRPGKIGGSGGAASSETDAYTNPPEGWKVGGNDYQKLIVRREPEAQARATIVLSEGKHNVTKYAHGWKPIKDDFDSIDDAIADADKFLRRQLADTRYYKDE